ncbi:MAG: phosphoethanolamine--lipid A transferase [Proteobacteria bacterium]|nr:phosphoethanolamine--lipid A transferase [Pseudomonadota bacterium]
MKITSCKFNLIFSLFFFLAYNDIFIRKLYGAVAFSGLFIGVLSVLLLFSFIGANLLFWKPLTKTTASLLMLINAVCLYFMQTYSVSIDKIMLLNVMQTDSAEAADLLNLRLFAFVAAGALLPAAILYKTKIIYAPFGQEIRRRLLLVMVSLALICAIILPNYKTAAQFLRNNRPLRYDLLPVNYIGAVISAVKIIKKRNHPLVSVGTDAVFRQAANGKKNLIIVVVGETARAQNFSLGGYHRPTNQPLDKFKQDLYYFTDTSSCGTATAVSLPCMFSPYGRDSFKPGSEAYTENVLDVMQRSGYSVLWRENNSGCKDVCNRIERERFCKDTSCADDILLRNFTSAIETFDNNTVVVLHQQGSHGPAYYKRYPKDFEIYKPACNTGQLDKCSQQEIINAYDNSITYSSHMIARAIEKLQKLQNKYNVALLYMSDHGESLGENGIYLHSAPYMLAPKTQTQIPFFIWLPPQSAQAYGINPDCLKNKLSQPASHDNLFHILLGLGNVQTSVYDKNLDILALCRKNSTAG